MRPTKRDTQDYWRVNGKEIIGKNEKFSFGKFSYTLICKRFYSILCNKNNCRAQYFYILITMILYILNDVFESNDTKDLYTDVVAPMVDEMLAKDKNSGIILYGYYGTGKSYTIFGKDDTSEILQRSLTKIKEAVKPHETIS